MIHRARCCRPLVLALLVALGMTVACSSVRQIDTQGIRRIHLADPARLELLDGTLEEHGEAILLIPADTALRLDVSVTLPVALLVPGKNLIRFTRDTQLYVSKNDEMLLSPDGQRWAGLFDKGALRELYGFSGGTLEFGLAVGKEKGAALSVAITTK